MNFFQSASQSAGDVFVLYVSNVLYNFSNCQAIHPSNIQFLHSFDCCYIAVSGDTYLLLVCKSGFYGDNCNMSCRACPNNATCNGWNASCPESELKEKITFVNVLV